MKFDRFRKKLDSRSVRHAYLAAKRRQAMMTRIDIVMFAVLLVAGIAVLAGFIGRPDNGDAAGTGLFKPAKQQETPSPLADKKLYVDPHSNAARQAEIWRPEAPDKAEQMDKLADQPGAKWFSNAITFDEVRGYVQAANDNGAIPVTVAYYIPKRDCNKYSQGGAPDQAAYYDYIDTYAKAIGSLQAVVVLEPDALVHTWSQDAQGQPCLTPDEQQMYYTLLSYAVDRFKSLPATIVYVDAGNSGWAKDTADMAERLKKAGIGKADGFSLNVSNFHTTEDTIKYGTEIARKLGDKHFIIDTSRNGLGPFTNDANPAYNWCNPPGRALGHYPTVQTEEPLVDAYLYIKNIGESDGSDPDPNKCFGGPRAGEWWPEYALGLVERWPKELQYAFRP